MEEVVKIKKPKGIVIAIEDESGGIYDIDIEYKDWMDFKTFIYTIVEIAKGIYREFPNCVVIVPSFVKCPRCIDSCLYLLDVEFKDNDIILWFRCPYCGEIVKAKVVD